MPTFTETNLPLEALLLDPNNYRFLDRNDYVPADPARAPEETVQSRAYRRLREDEGLQSLRASILRNGFLAIERIVVRPALGAEDKYVVLEGNRRLAALRWLRDDHEAGVAIPEALLDTFERVPVVLVGNLQEDPATQEALMGIRHVSGIKDWGGYQRAKLVSDLRDKYSLESVEVAERLAMSVQEVNRRYRALKALEQMQRDEEFSDRARPVMYPLFHEAVAVPIIRDWLGWSADQLSFTNFESTRQFYELITTSEDEEGNNKEPRIGTYAEVRELRNVLSHADAKRAFLEGQCSLVDALALIRNAELTSAWKTEVAEALAAIDAIALNEVRQMSEDDIDQLERLREKIAEVLDAKKRLT